MREYEIRVFRENGTSTLIAAEIALSDQAAIRSGMNLAKGRRFEVWRGFECIFQQPARARSA